MINTDLVTFGDVKKNDVIEGPDGPSLVTSVDLEKGIIFFRERHCMSITPRQKIIRYVSASILEEAGLKLP